ncbi:CCHC-type zinc finger, nucleic acid binding protein a, partial [Elysia marginata]
MYRAPCTKKTQTRNIVKRRKSRPKYLDDYYVDDEIDNLSDENDHINVTMHYFYRMADIPSNYHEAMTSKDADKWKLAMDDEMRALGENETFQITPLPAGRKAVGGRWVFAIKSGPNEEKHKARFVAKGYSQIPEIDYEETFSPIARMTSIRTVIQLAVQNNLDVHQMDVKAAYLNAPIEKKYMLNSQKAMLSKHHCSQEGIFLTNLIKDIMSFESAEAAKDLEKFTLFCDNTGAIAMSKNPVCHQRSKHIDIRYRSEARHPWGIRTVKRWASNPPCNNKSVTEMPTNTLSQQGLDGAPAIQADMASIKVKGQTCKETSDPTRSMTSSRHQ